MRGSTRTHQERRASRWQNGDWGSGWAAEPVCSVSTTLPWDSGSRSPSKTWGHQSWKGHQGLWVLVPFRNGETEAPGGDESCLKPRSQ